MRRLTIFLVVVASSSFASANEPAQGRQLFLAANPPCAACHTLQDAGAQGAVGPSLDELRPDAARVVKALKNGIGQMPSYAGRLTEAQMAAIAAYVVQATEGK